MINKKEINQDIKTILNYIESNLKGKEIYSINRTKYKKCEFFDILINPIYSHEEISIITGIKREQVQKWRRRNIPNNLFEKYFKVCKRYTDLEINKIKNEESIERSYEAIKHKKRELNLVDYTKKNFRSELRNSEIIKMADKRKIPYTKREIELILTSDLNAKELALQLGRTTNAIWCIRNKYKERNKNELVCN